MSVLFQKILSFFTAIVIWFCSLFGIRSELPVLPQVQEDVPAYTYGTLNGVYRSSGTTVVQKFSRTTAEDLNKYKATLEENGFSVYDEYRIEDNLFAAYTNGKTAVFLSWFKNTGITRIVSEEQGELCPLTDPYTETTETLLTGMKGETVVAMEGMGYIIRLADGSFCIIDGGMGDPDGVDADKLMDILEQQKPEGSGKPVIAAWLFTHLHGDHIGVFNCFIPRHRDDVVLEKLYFNFPTEQDTQNSESSYMMDDSIYRYYALQKNLTEYCADVPVVKVHTGNRFQVRNAFFEILFTVDDFYPETIAKSEMNDSSTVYKMTLEGQTFLWPGDSTMKAADIYLKEYGPETMNVDFLQMPHHGYNGSDKFFAAIDPTYTLLPIYYEAYERTLGYERNQWVLNSPHMKQMIVTGLGTWTIRLPYAPVDGTYERIPAINSVNPVYPARIGE